MNTKPLVIYHANCADGFGAAFAAWLKLGDEAEYSPMKYGDPVNDLIPGRDVYVLDFSFDRATTEALIKNARKFVWLDHHKTAFEMWCGEIPVETEEWYEMIGDEGIINLDNNRSGAMIAWDHFNPTPDYPWLIKYLDDYDRWKFEYRSTKAFNKALWSTTPWSFTQWKEMLNNLEQNGYEGMYNVGAAMLKAHEQNVQAVVRGAGRECQIPVQKETQWVIIKGLAANCPPHLSSDVGHELATDSGTYGLLWYINKENKCLCSLRSNGDYDVSAIAKSFGGGGHKNAAGFEVPVEILLGWIR